MAKHSLRMLDFSLDPTKLEMLWSKAFQLELGQNQGQNLKTARSTNDIKGQ